MEQIINNKKYKKYFCSFADKRMYRSLRRIEAQAIAMNCYENIFVYHEEKLAPDFRAQFKTQLKPSRGFGYWVWKPQVILQSLEKINEGDILQYTDAGCHLNPLGHKRLEEYFDIANKSQIGILAFGGKEPEDPSLVKSLILKEKHWTKGDVFEFFGVKENPLFYDTEQIWGGVLFIKKSKESVAFIQQWLKVFQDNFSLADDSPSISSNFAGFIEHRHDQSIFSILCKLHTVPFISTSEINQIFIQNVTERFKNYPIWAIGDKKFNFWRTVAILLIKVKNRLFQ